MVTCPRGHQSQATDYCDECGTPIGGVTRAAPAAPAAPEAAATTGPPCPDCGGPQTGRFCEVCGYDFIMAKLGGGSTTPPGATPAATAAPATTPAPASSRVEPSPDATTPGPDATVGPDQSGADPVGPDPDAAPATPGSLPVRGAPDGTGPAIVAGRWRLVVAADTDYHARMQAQREPDVAEIPLPAFCPERRFALTGTQALIGRRSTSRGIEPEVDLSGPPADPAVSHAHALLLAEAGGSWAVVDLDSANGTYVNDAEDPIAANVPMTLSAGDRVHVGAWTTLTLEQLP
jgi:FHA domain